MREKEIIKQEVELEEDMVVRIKNIKMPPNTGGEVPNSIIVNVPAGKDPKEVGRGILKRMTGKVPTSFDVVKETLKPVEDKEEVQENLGDLAHKVEQDHEIQLARGELYKAAKYSIKLHDMLKGMSEAEGLDGWVSAKITKASDYLGTVFHHLDYQTKFDEVSESTCNCSCGKEICESCGKTHKKKKVKEETKFTSQQIKQAYGIANDPRYKQGNYSGAVKAIEKLAKGLSSHPDVQKVLKRTNEVELEEDIVVRIKNIKMPPNTGGEVPNSIIVNVPAGKDPKEVGRGILKRMTGKVPTSFDVVKEQLDEKTLKQMAWRHGYGKMSSHYVDRVKNETYKDQLQTKLEAKKNED